MKKTPDRDHKIPIRNVAGEIDGAVTPSSGPATALGRRAKPDLVDLLAGAFASSAPKVTSDVAYKAAVAIVCARSGRAAIEDARAHMGPIPAAPKTEIAAARAERLRKREERSGQSASGDPLRVPFHARIPALRAKRKQAHQDWRWQVYEDGAETPVPLKPARVAYAERQADAVARSMPSLTHERQWKRAVASLRDSIPQESWHRVPSLKLEGEATAEERNVTIAALVDFLSQNPPEELAAAIAVVRTFHWTPEDVEGHELLAELRQLLRELRAAFDRDGGFLKTGVVRADPPRAAQKVARVVELLELLEVDLNEIDNPRPPIKGTRWTHCFELVEQWLAIPTNMEPHAQVRARHLREEKALADESARSDAKAREFFDDVVMSGEFDDDPPEPTVSAIVSRAPDGSPDGEDGAQ